jgi:hypothetical protein
MFGFGKKDKPSGGLVRFLEDAEDAYILAFKSKNIRPFTEFASSSVCTQILELILGSDERNFGLERYRERKWLVKEEKDNTVTILKEITHKDINIGRGMSITIADNVKQLWVVSVIGYNNYRIVKIEHAKE